MKRKPPSRTERGVIYMVAAFGTVLIAIVLGWPVWELIR